MSPRGERRLTILSLSVLPLATGCGDGKLDRRNERLSGALEQVIENGGKADLFFSAAQKQMDMLEAAGELVEGTHRDLLRNEIVLIVPKDSALAIEDFADLTSAEVKRVVFAASAESSGKCCSFPKIPSPVAFKKVRLLT